MNARRRATNASAADVKDLDRSLELIVCEGEHVRIGRIGQDHC